MSHAFSAFLDFLRFGAAFAVLAGHMEQDGFQLAWFPLAHLSHEAVIIFFVLSGYIIHHSTVNAGRDLRSYVIARASRVYSVALPAVIFSILVAAAVQSWLPHRAAELANYRAPSLSAVTQSLLFLNQNWEAWRATAEELPMNDPYWSMCYEVWYYVIFGAWVFTRGRWRWPVTLGAVALAGPSIIWLMPVWLFGATYSHYRKRLPSFSPRTASLVFVFALLCLLGNEIWQVDVAVRTTMREAGLPIWRLGESQRWVTDYVLGLVLVAFLHAFHSAPERVQHWFARHQRALAAWAGFSFTIYLFHRPMTQLLGLMAHERQWGPVAAVIALAGLTAVLWLISRLTEARLPSWRAALQRWWPAAPAPG